MKYFYEMYCGDSFIYDTIVETFLTGDIEIKDNEHLELFDERIEEEKSYLLIQFPHHGSENKNIRYFIDLTAGMYVFSYGIVNRYGHPHSEVLQCLPNIALVNERESFDYQIMLHDFGWAKAGRNCYIIINKRKSIYCGWYQSRRGSTGLPWSMILARRWGMSGGRLRRYIFLTESRSFRCARDNTDTGCLYMQALLSRH